MTELLILMLRAIINDYDGSQYSDDRLTHLLYVASRIVLAEIRDLKAYSIDGDEAFFEIDPTPTDLLNSLIVTKAACLLTLSELKLAAQISGLSARCGPATISANESRSAWDTLIKYGPCKAYDDLKQKIEFYDPFATGSYYTAILTPFINSRFKTW